MRLRPLLFLVDARPASAHNSQRPGLMFAMFRKRAVQSKVVRGYAVSSELKFHETQDETRVDAELGRGSTFHPRE